uniref:Uncharacterized protein n=1 Tax=viral metagenome TaxID=1070528 RepID=A0A6M3XV11_9ZZZZ
MKREEREYAEKEYSETFGIDYGKMDEAMDLARGTESAEEEVCDVCSICDGGFNSEEEGIWKIDDTTKERIFVCPDCWLWRHE